VRDRLTRRDVRVAMRVASLIAASGHRFVRHPDTSGAMPTDRDLEAETVVRFDRSGEPMVCFTADPAEAGRWRRLGYAVSEDGRCWSCRVPIACLALLPLRDGQPVISRYLPEAAVRRSTRGPRLTRTPQRPSDFAKRSARISRGREQGAGDKG
jgi:hypothetical protein